MRPAAARRDRKEARRMGGRGGDRLAGERFGEKGNWGRSRARARAWARAWLDSRHLLIGRVVNKATTIATGYFNYSF